MKIKLLLTVATAALLLTPFVLRTSEAPRSGGSPPPNVSSGILPEAAWIRPVGRKASAEPATHRQGSSPWGGEAIAGTPLAGQLLDPVKAPLHPFVISSSRTDRGLKTTGDQSRLGSWPAALRNSPSVGWTAQEQFALNSFRSLSGESEGTEPVSLGTLVEAGLATQTLSTQSFENFYAALFDPTGSRSPGKPASSQGPGPADSAPAVAPDGNPFADAINNMGSESGKTAPPVTTGSGSGASGAQPTETGTAATQSPGKEKPAGPGKPAPDPVKPPQPDPPAPGDRTVTPVPHPQLPGGVRSFAVIGNIPSTGLAQVRPAIYVQGEQFEIPFLGTVTLKLTFIADPATERQSIVVDDLNGDLIPDLAMVRGFDPFLLVWLGLPGGEFYYLGATEIPSGGESLATGDFNGDGARDLALVQSRNNRQVDVLYGNRTGTFRYAGTTRFPTGVDVLSSVDLLGERREDLVGMSLLDLQAHVLGGPDSKNKNSILSFLNFPSVQAVGDLNYDGRLDQIFLFQQLNQVSVVLNPARSQGVRHIANMSLSDSVFLLLGDLFGRGSIDLAVAIRTR